MHTTLLTVPEVADELRVSTRTAWTLVLEERLPSLRIGKSRRVRRADLLAYIDGQLLTA